MKGSFDPQRGHNLQVENHCHTEKSFRYRTIAFLNKYHFLLQWDSDYQVTVHVQSACQLVINTAVEPLRAETLGWHS